MKNRKKDISETLLSIWTGICSDRWLIAALECKETEAVIIAVLWVAVPVVAAFMYYIITNVLQSRKKAKAKRFIETWAKLEIKERKNEYI